MVMNNNDNKSYSLFYIRYQIVFERRMSSASPGVGAPLPQESALPGEANESQPPDSADRTYIIYHCQIKERVYQLWAVRTECDEGCAIFTLE